jgi:hypothetical protein
MLLTTNAMVKIKFLSKKYQNLCPLRKDTIFESNLSGAEVQKFNGVEILLVFSKRIFKFNYTF